MDSVTGNNNELQGTMFERVCFFSLSFFFFFFFLRTVSRKERRITTTLIAGNGRLSEIQQHFGAPNGFVLSDLTCTRILAKGLKWQHISIILPRSINFQCSEQKLEES